MACQFSQVTNQCGCITGYNLPLQTVEGEDIISYPVTVLNVNEVELAQADSPSEYAAIWNLDPDNQAIGTLYVGVGAYCFYLVKKTGATVPEEVLGDPIALGEFSDDFNEDFFI